MSKASVPAQGPAVAALLSAAVARHQAGDLKAAETQYKELSTLAPEAPEIWQYLGLARLQLGDYPGAAAAYEELLSRQANHADGLDQYGAVLFELGRRDEAEAVLRRAIAAAPTAANPYTNLGRVFQNDAARAAEALALHDQALALKPTYAAAHNNRGAALTALSRHTEAIASFEKAIALKPALAEAHNNLGNALYRAGDVEGAVRAFSQAVKLNPLYAEAHWNLAVALLSREDYARGWAEYEWRWKCRDFLSTPRGFALAAWKGEDMKGPLLVWGEQGLGDEILYTSMAADLTARGIPLVWEADARLVPLIARSRPGVSVVPRTSPPALAAAGAAAQISAASLGQYLRREVRDFPAERKKFMTADAARAAALRARLLRSGKKRVIGLSWISKNTEFGAHKTCTLSDLAPLWQAAGAETQFVDLQYGDTAAERAAAGLDLAHLDDIDVFTDVEGLAALTAACDLVITVSNTTAHLAGALGVPVWVVASLGNGKLWYWGAEGTASRWYPSATIFRQHRLGSWNGVIAEVAATLSGDAPDHLLARAATLHKAGELGGAEALYRAALRAAPKSFDALHMLGVVSMQTGRNAQGLALIDQALEANASDPFAFHHRGAALQALGRDAEAVEAYGRALALDPKRFESLNDQGASLKSLGRLDDALRNFERALALNPAFAPAHSNTGDVLRALGRSTEALDSYARALRIDPTLVDTWAKQGNALRNASRYNEAVASFDRALALKPDHVDAQVNRATVLNEGGRGSEALAAFNTALTHNPEHPEGRWNRSLVLLSRGDWAAGWPEYEWRWRCKESKALARAFPQPLWRGQALDGALLVWGEQGIGDEILFARAMTDLQRSLVWEADPRLVALLKRSFPTASMVPRTTPADAATHDPSIKAQIAAGSLGAYVRPPGLQTAYLKADTARSRALRARLLGDKKKRLIGISWVSKNPDSGARKTCPLTALAPLWQAAGSDAQFVDLQYGDTRAERTTSGLDLVHLDDLDLHNDIDGIAALVAACDAVVTVSNTTAHLAGALGIPVKVMISKGSGKLWYWGDGHMGQPWYASAEIFRQSQPDVWDDVVAAVAKRI